MKIIQNIHRSLDEHDEHLESTTIESSRYGFARLVTVLILIAATVLFERTQHKIYHIANKNFKRVVDHLFGELSVLGFLSLCTFIISQTDFFVSIASDDEEAEELFELVELTHYGLFFIMIKYVLNVCVLIAKAKKIQMKWTKFQSFSRVYEADKNVEMYLVYRKSSIFTILFPDLSEVARFRQFCALKTEFFLNRDFHPPFKPTPEERRLDESFDYSAYLGRCLENTLEEMVVISETSWLVISVFAVFFYMYNTMLAHHYPIIPWVWIGIYFVINSLNFLFRYHLSQVLDKLGTNPALLREKSNEKEGYILSGDELLPEWCNIKYDEERSNHHGNRQYKLFYFQEDGPKIYLFWLQLNLVFSAAYWAVSFVSYFPYMYNESETPTFVFYAVLALAPSILAFQQWISIMAVLTEVSSFGNFRRPKVIATVTRKQKLESMIRSFLMIKNVKEFVEKVENPAETDFLSMSERSNGKTKPRRSSGITQRQVQNAFKTIDKDGDGFLDPDEFQLMMTNLGMPVTNEMGRKIVHALDIDGDGVIDMTELELFYKTVLSESKGCPHEMAKDLFSIFDVDGNGEISPNEFAESLETFNLGFSIEDIGEILQEVDENGDGTITFHEFERVIQEYAPRDIFDCEAKNEQSDTYLGLGAPENQPCDYCSFPFFQSEISGPFRNKEHTRSSKSVSQECIQNDTGYQRQGSDDAV